MIGLLKMLFDICLYYALSGFYIYVIAEQYPLTWGVPVLAVTVIAYILLGGRSRQRASLTPTTGAGAHPRAGAGADTGFRTGAIPSTGVRAGVGATAKAVVSNFNITPVNVICCTIPGLLLIFGATFWQALQYIPVWAFLAYSILINRMHTNHEDFKDHFIFGSKLLLIVFPGLLTFDRVATAVTSAAPYLIICFLTGVCLMRILREEGKRKSGRNIATLLLLLACSAAVAFLQMPQLLLSLIGFIYKYVIVWILMGIIFIITTIGNAIAALLSLLFKPHTIDVDQPLLEIGAVETPPPEEGIEYVLNTTPEWVSVVLYALLVLVVALVVFLIFRRLLGNAPPINQDSAFIEERESLRKTGRDSKRSVFRPREPRLLVRWYYHKYLAEGKSRGAKPTSSDTSLQIRRKYDPYFPEREDSQALRDLYIKARYRHSAEITKADAQSAADVWQRLNM